MVAATMSIDLDPETAEAVAEASPEERKKWALLLRLRLRELTSLSPRSLQQVMDDIGAKAAAAGLTPEILESLLNDE
jgi:ferritin-like protein